MNENLCVLSFLVFVYLHKFRSCYVRNIGNIIYSLNGSCHFSNIINFFLIDDFFSGYLIFHYR